MRFSPFIKEIEQRRAPPGSRVVIVSRQWFFPQYRLGYYYSLTKVLYYNTFIITGSLMRINARMLQKLYKDKRIAPQRLLEKSGVSKTAYYNILYKRRLLPGSIYDLAKVLGVSPSAFLEEENPEEIKIMRFTSD